MTAELNPYSPQARRLRIGPLLLTTNEPMKILNFLDFVALPAGAIFSYYDPAICTGLYRKGESLVPDGAVPPVPTDFFKAPLLGECKFYAGRVVEPPIVDLTESRWNDYDEHALFAVYEADDIMAIISALIG